MRTLIVSDLHLGLRSGIDVLRHPQPQARLLQAVETVDRLVLLGDTLELSSRPARTPPAFARELLSQIGARLGPQRSVIVVPGNHDGRLVRDWALARGRALGIADPVDPATAPALQALAAWLAPAQVSVSYPGVWLDERVWATHGHYLDRHLVPESAFGFRRSALGLRFQGSASAAIEYELARRAQAARRRDDSFIQQLRARPIGTLLHAAAAATRLAATSRAPHAVMRARVAPLVARLLDGQMRRAATPALVEVAARLGVDADWIVFGHVHRNGPRVGIGGGADEPVWRPDPNGPRMVNTGAWVFEPLLLEHARPPHPYWPGGAVMLETGGEPSAIGLLDDLGASAWRPAR